MSGGPPVLVVGNFPPVATAGAATTLAVVRELWADGEEVETISPRPSAARQAIPIAGPLGGYRLATQRRVTGARRLVLVAEPDLPVPTRARPRLALPVLQWLTVRQLVAAMDGFDQVTLVSCGDHRVPATFWRRLAAAADEVRDLPEATGTPGITARGPKGLPIDRARLATSIVVRKVFGRHTPAVRALASRPVQALRTLRRA